MTGKPLALSKLFHVESNSRCRICRGHALGLRGRMHWIVGSGGLRCGWLDCRLRWRRWRRWRLHWSLGVRRWRRSGALKLVRTVAPSWWGSLKRKIYKVFTQHVLSQFDINTKRYTKTSKCPTWKVQNIVHDCMPRYANISCQGVIFVPKLVFWREHNKKEKCGYRKKTWVEKKTKWANNISILPINLELTPAVLFSTASYP